MNLSQRDLRNRVNLGMVIRREFKFANERPNARLLALHNMVVEAKAKLRQMLRVAVNRITAAERHRDSALACARLLAQPIWAGARSVLTYSHLEQEIDLTPLTKQALDGGKTVAFLAFDEAAERYRARGVGSPERDLRPGRFGILEPAKDCPEIPLNQLDLILVPGVAFDLNGHRLGRGRGYYDRLLAQADGIKCGVAFDEQIQPELPAEPHDIAMDYLLTPTRWLVFDRNSA